MAWLIFLTKYILTHTLIDPKRVVCFTGRVFLTVIIDGDDPLVDVVLLLLADADGQRRLEVVAFLLQFFDFLIHFLC